MPATFRRLGDNGFAEEQQQQQSITLPQRHNEQNCPTIPTGGLPPHLPQDLPQRKTTTAMVRPGRGTFASQVAARLRCTSRRTATQCDATDVGKSRLTTVCRCGTVVAACGQCRTSWPLHDDCAPPAGMPSQQSNNNNNNSLVPSPNGFTRVMVTKRLSFSRSYRSRVRVAPRSTAAKGQ